MRFSSLASVGIAAALVVAACGSSNDKTHTTSGPGGGATSTTTTASTGTTSSSGGPGGAGGSGGGEVYPAPHPAAPIVLDKGGPTFTSPTVVPVFFTNDDQVVVGQLKTFMTQLGPSTYWTDAGKAYGIKAPKVLPPVDLAETPSGTIDDMAIQTWLEGKLNGNDPAFPAPDAGTIVTIFYPAGVTVTQGATKSCSAFYGYHTSITLDAAHGGKDVAYAVVPRCGPALGPLTQTATHELFEAATDPLPLVMPAYTGLDDDHVLWELFVGGEVGDLCDISPSFGKFPGVDQSVQRIWSNPEAAASHDPCVPHPAGQVYFAAVPVLTDQITTNLLGMPIQTKVAAIDVGSSKTIDVALFSDGPTTGAWKVKAYDAAGAAGGSPLLSLSLDKSTGSNGDTLHLTIKALQAGAYGYALFYVTSTLGTQTNAWLGVVSSAVKPGMCATAGSAQACYTCCVNADVAGVQFYEQTLEQNCVCPAGATCNAPCTTAGSNLCATPPQQPSAACGNCLNNLQGSDPCVTTTFTTCNGDPGCAAYLACASSCPP